MAKVNKDKQELRKLYKPLALSVPPILLLVGLFTSIKDILLRGFPKRKYTSFVFDGRKNSLPSEISSKHGEAKDAV